MTDRMKNGECCPYNGYRGLHSPWCKGSALASQAKQAVQPPEFQEVSWGVDSVMRPCKSMAISEYAFREWAETNGIALALPAPIEQITPGNTDGVRVDAPTKCKDCGAKITDGAAKCPRGGGRTCWVGQQPTVGVNPSSPDQPKGGA